MSTSLYDTLIPTLAGGLGALATVLDKGAAYAAERDIDPRVLLRARLFPDMHPFTRQVQNATDLARRSPERLVGREPSSAEDPAPSFDALSARVKQTREHVQGFDRAAFEGAESRAITLNIGQTLELTGTSYALSFTLPNFLFHVTTAYDILRHNGVALGKRDYLGPFLAG